MSKALVANDMAQYSESGNSISQPGTNFCNTTLDAKRSKCECRITYRKSTEWTFGKKKHATLVKGDSDILFLIKELHKSHT